MQAWVSSVKASAFRLNRSKYVRIHPGNLIDDKGRGREREIGRLEIELLRQWLFGRIGAL